MDIQINISAKKLAWILGGFSCYLCIQSLLAQRYEYAVGTDSTYWTFNLVELVNVNLEANFPTWYSSLLLLICVFLLAVIAYGVKLEEQPHFYRWTGLMLIFLYLSIDEAAAIHERFTVPLRDAYHTSGYLYFAWVLVAIPFIVLVGTAYLRFTLKLPARTRNLFVLAALLYIGGALIIEAISANQWYQVGGTSLTFSTIGTIEEWLEMLGTVVFIYALLDYLGTAVTYVQIAVKQS